MTLLNKTVLITGGGSGIGAATAMALADAGCRVAISGRRQEKLDEVAGRFSGEPSILTHTVDIADRDSVAALFDWAAESLGSIDILVQCAGINVARRSMAETSPEDWDRVMQVNATGVFNGMHAVLPGMRERKDGLIINISSVAGIRASVLGGVAYSASKFAMAALGLTAAQEEKDFGIRVTNIYPGEVNTPILDDRKVPITDEHRAKILQPEDIAAAVLMVAALPPRANVPELTIKPTVQAFA